MRYLSLFSGVGGFEKGIIQAYETIRNTNVSKIGGRQETSARKLQEDGQGLHSIPEQTAISSKNRNNELPDRSIDERQPNCIGFSEIDKYATKIYQQHFPEHKNYGDIKLINESDLPDFDLLVGGFPCQSFSIAGKRGGFEDTRGTLFFDIARILQAKKPRLFCLENVKGLLSHDNGQTFKTIISTLDELGYDIQWQVLNSKNFGVPQNRERVFIIGHLRGTSRPQVFPFGEANDSSIKVHSRGKHQQDIVYKTDGIMTSLPAGTHASTPHLTKILQLNKSKHSNDRIYGKEEIRQQFIPEDSKIRRLTPTECARLQGFPDNWHKIEGISDSRAYKCYGNAVTVNVIQAIMNFLSLKHIEEKV